MICKERVKELGLFSVVKRKLRDSLTACLKGFYSDGGAKLLLLVADDVILPKIVTGKFQSGCWGKTCLRGG